jgi:uncharacterized protein YegL
MKQFAAKTARPIPVILLADTSASMSVDGKHEVMNQAVRDLIKSFSKESRLNAEIHLSVITFGGSAEMHLPLTPVHKIEDFKDFNAAGGTPMGAALKITKELIEDKEIITSRAYRPVIILISDGHPTDDWEDSFSDFCNSERAKKATRMAMAIGNDANEVMMNDFINDLEAPLFRGDGASDITRFFRAVSMSVTSRSRSATPNQIGPVNYASFPSDDDELDLDFD